MTKESLAQTASDITENLMSISRMMAQQVQQSEETVTTLGKWSEQKGIKWLWGMEQLLAEVAVVAAAISSSTTWGHMNLFAPHGPPSLLSPWVLWSLFSPCHNAPGVACIVTCIMFFLNVLTHCFPFQSNILEDSPRNKWGVQDHDWNHPTGEETHHQVQPQGAHGQAAHLLGAGALPRHGPLHCQEETVPLPVDQVLFEELSLSSPRPALSAVDAFHPNDSLNNGPHVTSHTLLHTSACSVEWGRVKVPDCNADEREIVCTEEPSKCNRWVEVKVLNQI